MQNTFKFSFVMAAWLASAASAATLYDCSGGTGEDAASVKVNVVSTTAPNGSIRTTYVAQLTASAHASGPVTVRRFVGPDGATSYTNKEKEMVLVVHATDLNNAGKIARIDASADFLDASGKGKGAFGRRWLDCR